MRNVRRRTAYRRPLVSYKRTKRSFGRKGSKGVLSRPKNKPVKISPLLRSAIKKVVKGQEETKEFVTSLPTVTYNGGTFANFSVSDIGQGIGENARIGEQVIPFGLRFRYFFTNTSTVETIYVRMIVVKSKNISNSANPTALSLLFKNLTDDAVSFTTAGAAGSEWQLMQFPLSNRDYTPVFSRVMKLAAKNNDGLDMKLTFPYIPISGKINFQGALGGANNQDHRYFVIFLSYSPSLTLAATNFTVGGSSQLLYKDA